jgi:hypothetical protein
MLTTQLLQMVSAGEHVVLLALRWAPKLASGIVDHTLLAFKKLFTNFFKSSIRENSSFTSLLSQKNLYQSQFTATQSSLGPIANADLLQHIRHIVFDRTFC